MHGKGAGELSDHAWQKQQGVIAMIKKLKDIFYDYNDILVAMIIIAVAGLVIANNIDSIMAYPASVAENIEVSGKDGPMKYADNPPIVEPGNGAAAGSGDGTTGTDGPTGEAQNPDGQSPEGQSSDGQNAGTNVGNAGQNNMGGGASGNPGANEADGSGSQSGSGSGSSGLPANIAVTIPTGSSGDRIADILLQAGLIKDKQDFNQAVIAAGAEGKLRAGYFVIPSNATPAEIISILTR